MSKLFLLPIERNNYFSSVSKYVSVVCRLTRRPTCGPTRWWERILNVLPKFLEGAYAELVEVARDSCEGEITTEGLKKAVDPIEKDKSPGLDCITNNFYKHFWHMLGDKLVQVYNYAFGVGHLSVSQRRGVISLLFKKGDRTQLKNWRPIILLTTDYKILSKALANRLHGVLPLIIHSDQTASIRGRTIIINENA